MRYSRDLRARQPGGRRSLIQQLLSALGRYPGSSLYVHGAGVVSGIQAGNWLFSNATTAATVDNPVGRIDDVRGGVAALQDTTQKKVTLRRGLVNTAQQSKNISHSAWAKNGLSVSGEKLVESAVAEAHFLSSIQAYTAGTYTIAAQIEKSDRNFAFVGTNAAPFGFLGFISVNLTTGAVTVATGSPLAFSSQLLTDGSVLVCISFTTTSTGVFGPDVRISTDGVWANRAYLGNGSSGIFVRNTAQFGGVVTAQQIIEAGGIPITTTASASSATGPWSHQFDGADDSFGTTLTPVNAGFVCVGANFYDNNLRTVLGAGAGATTGDAGVWLSRNAGNLTLYTSDGASRQSVSAAYPIGTNAIASAGWSADSMLVGANNTEATAAKTLNCATAAKQVAIGMMTAAGSTAGMLGTLGGAMIIVPALPTPADRALMRRLVGNLYGVKL